MRRERIGPQRPPWLAVFRDPSRALQVADLEEALLGAASSRVLPPPLSMPLLLVAPLRRRRAASSLGAWRVAG